MCPAGDPCLTGTGMVCSECRGVRLGCWNDLGTDLAVSVEGHSGQHLPVWNTALVAAPAVVSKDEVMVLDWALCKGKKHFAL